MTKSIMVLICFCSLLNAEDIKVTLSTDKAVYKLGDLIRFKLVIENNSSETRTVNLPVLDNRSVFFGFKYKEDGNKLRTYYPEPSKEKVSSMSDLGDLIDFYGKNKVVRDEQFIIELGDFPIPEMLKSKAVETRVLKQGEKLEGEIAIYAVRAGHAKVLAYYTGHIQAAGLWVFKRYQVSNPVEIDIKGKSIRVKMETDIGELELKLLPDLALNHAYHFFKLCKEGYYEKTYFHRIIKGFMVQGGDPNSKDDDPANDGLGGPSYLLPAEFSDAKHVNGILSMARAVFNNSAGSQFFIVTEAYTTEDKARQASLNGKYTVFGELIKESKSNKTLYLLSKTPSDMDNNGKVQEKVYIRKTEVIVDN